MGLRGRASLVREWQLRYRSPVRLSLGPFEELELPDCEEVRLGEVDRDSCEGFVWLVQQELLASPRAVTLLATVRRPGTQSEELRLVLLCEGGPSGAGC